jgi:hypothetical protein
MVEERDFAFRSRDISHRLQKQWDWLRNWSSLHYSSIHKSEWKRIREKQETAITWVSAAASTVSKTAKTIWQQLTPEVVKHLRMNHTSFAF